MNKDKFKVTARRGIWGTLSMVGTIAFLTVPFIAYFMMNPHILIFLLGLPFLVMALVFFIYNVMFYIKVDGNRMKGRTSGGRGYHFELSDITKITCSHRSTGGEHGVGIRQNYITITAGSVKIEIKDNMGGFETMAAYLLHKAESGEISAAVISGYAMKKLNECATEKNQNDSGNMLFVGCFIAMVLYFVVTAMM